MIFHIGCFFIYWCVLLDFDFVYFMYCIFLMIISDVINFAFAVAIFCPIFVTWFICFLCYVPFIFSGVIIPSVSLFFSVSKYLCFCIAFCFLFVALCLFNYMSIWFLVISLFLRFSNSKFFSNYLFFILVFIFSFRTVSCSGCGLVCSDLYSFFSVPLYPPCFFSCFSLFFC